MEIPTKETWADLRVKGSWGWETMLIPHSRAHTTSSRVYREEELGWTR